MRQKAQVIRTVSPGYVEVKVRRQSACASAHNCGSCDHCSMMENAPEVIVVAQDARGAAVGDTVTVESASTPVLGAAVVVYLLPLFLFFLGYFITGALGRSEAIAITMGGVGFLLGILLAKLLDRWWRAHDPIQFQVVSIED